MLKFINSVVGPDHFKLLRLGIGTYAQQIKIKRIVRFAPSFCQGFVLSLLSLLLHVCATCYWQVYLYASDDSDLHPRDSGNGVP